jgi:Ser/Thr protein kinase RdoA (MazF antagonist)
MRVLKSNPHNAIQNEIQLLTQLNAQGAAVPVTILMARGGDFLVVADAGKTVNQWLASEGMTSELLQPILNDASIALAGLHSIRLSQGRPALRDIS